MAIIRSPFRQAASINPYEPGCFCACYLGAENYVFFWSRWEGKVESFRLLQGREKQVPSLVSYTRSVHWIFSSDVTAFVLALAPSCDGNEGGKTGWGRKGGQKQPGTRGGAPGSVRYMWECLRLLA